MKDALRTVLAVAVITAAVMVAPPAWAGDVPDIPAEFAVCVTTVDAGGRARLDGYYSVETDARARRAEILRDGWITTGDEYDREDEYPPHSIVKATIDPTPINRHSCLPPFPLKPEPSAGLAN